MVLARRIEAVDTSCQPYNFFIETGTTEYIFPPQETQLGHNAVSTLGEDSDTLEIDEAYSYDPDKVQAHLRIDYSGRNPPAMKIYDMLGHSTLLPEVAAAINQAFATTPPEQQRP